MSVLTDILQNTKKEVAARRRDVPLSRLMEQIQDMPPPLAFTQALRQPTHIAIIAEIKRASPSAGTIREGIDPVAVARAYARHGAAAISVLTDATYFGGSLSDLLSVRREVNLPLLCKDFMVDAYQIAESRAHGADAVLLLLNALSNSQYRELTAAAREHKMACLVEVHSKKELEWAVMAQAPLIGINNRDLNTFEVDVNTTELLMARMPSGVTTVCESGLRTRYDLQRMSRCGIDAALIGEALMREDDIGRGVQKFIGVEKCCG